MQAEGEEEIGCLPSDEQSNLGGYLIRRLLLMLLTLFGISVLIFVLLRLVPGDIADILFGASGMIDPAEKTQIIKDLGLVQPIPVQYVKWIAGLFHGDLGYSYLSEKPALDEILRWMRPKSAIDLPKALRSFA